MRLKTLSAIGSAVLALTGAQASENNNSSPATPSEVFAQAPQAPEAEQTIHLAVSGMT